MIVRASQWLITTLRDAPKDAEISSHQLMIKAGLIRKLGSGLYTWLPTGLKVLRKIEAIIREEMNNAGALEVLMPAVQPCELWQETGRWDTFGGQLLTMQDSQNRSYCFGPTHEEVITDLIRNEIQSYKQLPINLYQIQTKFRDEIRPRFGVMRAREFIMKDAYSFHLTDESLQETYNAMYTAYTKIFTRLGLAFRAVEADTGAIGGAVSHEFQVLADTGEDVIFYNPQGHYAANSEQAIAALPKIIRTNDLKPLTKIHTPNQKTIADICKFLNTPDNEQVKCLMVVGEKHPVVALFLRGDDELNPIKAAKHPLIKAPLTFATPEIIKQHMGADIGSLGPINCPVPMIVDHSAFALPEFTCGANINDYHYQNAVWDRDTKVTEVYDLRMVREGDQSPDGTGLLTSCRGIEVGHIFQLGSKYATAMGAQVLNENGQKQTLTMGCYGIGVSRLVAASIEQHHDDRGIIWPEAIAPFTVVIIPIANKDLPEIIATAEKLYSELTNLGIDVMLDDRALRPGVMFADHELLGIPHRIVIGAKTLAEHQVEYKKRTDPEPKLIKVTDLISYLKNILLP